MARGQAANDVQTAVRMPRELHERLQVAAGARPLGEEIRRRLEASFADALPAGGTPLTTNLLRELVKLSEIVSSTWGPIESDPGANAVFRLAAKQVVDQQYGWRPEGEPVLNPLPDASARARHIKSIEEAADMAAVASIIW